MPLISVIIPLYNSEKTIRETLESVLQQTFSDFEIIAVNDDSKDSTLDILATIKDPRLKVFSYPNRGLTVNRNRGLALAQGEFIAFLDHDDLWTADKLELQLKALQENPQAAVAYSWVDLIDESSQFIRSCPHFKDRRNVYERVLTDFIVVAISNPLIRKSALEKVGYLDESLFGPDDLDLFLRLAEHFEFEVVEKTQFLYRITNGSVSASVVRQARETLKVIESACQRYPESTQHLQKNLITNVYMHGAFRALDAANGRQNGIASAKCLWEAMKNDPSVLRRGGIGIALCKIAALLILPSGMYPKLINQVKQVKKSMNPKNKTQR
ncbi:glycosyltransferase family 2 protein [Floridanema evergladense]|uniref:Glycosyltransferase family 2 protein n=1 Tax=Floridaenema evergladense BLCC-F167 TaxID=3153639 RepID=A0ABV4WMJ7_9CYAN